MRNIFSDDLIDLLLQGALMALSALVFVLICAMLVSKIAISEPVEGTYVCTLEGIHDGNE